MDAARIRYRLRGGAKTASGREVYDHHDVAGREVVNRGEIVTLERPSKLQFTWLSSRWGNQETRVTLELEPADTQWQLVLTHERFPVEHSSGQLTAGWNQMVEKLAGVLDRNLLRVICQVK